MLTPLLVFVGALLIAFGATPIARRVAPRLGVMDHPNPRKVHARPMPLLGGAAIVVASIAPLFIFQERFEFQQLITVLFGAAFRSMLGGYDDR